MRYSVVFVIIAVASMLAGNLLALWQTNVKRILAYSSIAHFGYMLVAFMAGGHMAVEAVTFYLVAYTVTTLGAFGVVTVLSSSSRDADRLDDYQGLFWRRPLIAGIFTVMLLSLAGIPATMGFLAKFYVLAAGASATQWSLIIILVMTSAIGLFYYLRILVALYSASPEREASIQPVAPCQWLRVGPVDGIAHLVRSVSCTVAGDDPNTRGAVRGRITAI